MKPSHRLKANVSRYNNTQQQELPNISWNVNADQGYVDNSNGAFARRLCNFRSASAQDRGWDDASSGCPAPPDPTAGSRWNVGRTAPCHGTPDPPWSSTHQPTINQSAPKLQTTNPSPLHNLHFQPYIFPMLRLVLIKHLGKYH